MGWDNMVALMKVSQNFKSNPAAIGAVIHGVNDAVSEQSCEATMQVLHQMICPGRGFAATPLTTGPTFSPAKAISGMETLLDRDDAIIVSIKPDHHFIVLPLSGDSIAILQGFQGSYTLHDWLNGGKVPMSRATFMTNFRKLFSSTKATIQEGAVALFSIPGHDDEIRAWYNTDYVFATTIASAHTNLFASGPKATLATAG